MDKLFIALYLDEDVSVKIADVLRKQGFDVKTAVEAKMLHADDPTQLSYAISQERAIVTHNRDDFRNLAISYFEKGHHHYGIIVAVRRPTHDIVRRLRRILDRVSAEEMRDQIRFI